MERIAITDIAGIRIGQAEDAEGGTGVTVIIAPEGMAAGLDVRGGGPASRDTRILDPLAAAEAIHAVVLAGGSAYGLDCAGGVMRHLEQRGIGLPVGDAVVPLVCQSDIFDLGVGDASARPDAALAQAACEASEQGNYRDGNFGAGCGATVGKAYGMELAMKAGVGSYAVRIGALEVGAIVVLNALGDVFDPATGEQVAGPRDGYGGLANSQEALLAGFEAACAPGQEAGGAPAAPTPVTNTTLAAVVTNAGLPKAQLCKVAGMAHDGIARAVRPVHTSMDGDSVYALSVGQVSAPADVVGTLAALVVEQAILVAARAAEPAYGLPSVRSLQAARQATAEGK